MRSAYEPELLISVGSAMDAGNAGEGIPIPSGADHPLSPESDPSQTRRSESSGGGDDDTLSSFEGERAVFSPDRDRFNEIG